MLRSSECLAADDVTIRCHVRHSPQASTKEFTEPQEMICTMRVWHKNRTPHSNAVTRTVGMTHARSFDGLQQNRRNPQQHGPELVLTSNEPVRIHACCSGESFTDPISMPNRFMFRSASGVQRTNSHRSSSRPRQRISSTQSPNVTAPPNVLGDVTIPLADIMVVDMFGQGNSHQCNLTTLSHGYFELTMDNRNGQDILLAFLNASLPKNRVMGYKRTASELSNRSSGTRSFDVEAFTATRMSERLKSETMSEKLRRKVVRVFSSFEDLSAAFRDCTCGCSKDSISPAPHSSLSHLEKRDSPPPNYEHLECAPDRTPERLANYTTYTRDEATMKRMEMMNGCKLPSGLSVEESEGPELETTAL